MAMSDAEIYVNLNRLKAVLPREQYLEVEDRVMAPYRLKNRVTGAGLGLFCIMIFGYAAYRTKTDDFRSVEPIVSAPAPSAPSASSS
ncbi:hypothetical protein HDU82_004645 [Entophlyctis luteolus]|nr:hypothetical protein HDU82_004645 [Entophlyctis luteolus]